MGIRFDHEVVVVHGEMIEIIEEYYDIYIYIYYGCYILRPWTMAICMGDHESIKHSSNKENEDEKQLFPFAHLL